MSRAPHHKSPDGIMRKCKNPSNCKFGTSVDEHLNLSEKEAESVNEEAYAEQMSDEGVDVVQSQRAQSPEKETKNDAGKNTTPTPPDRDKNVNFTLDDLHPKEFDVDDDGNVIIDEDTRRDLEAEIAEGYIAESTSEDGKYVMLKYSRSATTDQRWNPTTVAFRGVLTDPEHKRVYARGFPKFFNTREHELRDGFPDLPTDEPIVLEKKMDGSLGLLTHVDGENRVYTSGSALQESNAIATVGKDILQDELAERGHPDWKPPKDTTVLTEVISDVNPVVVDYGRQRRLVVLGAVDNRTGRDVPKEELREMVPLEHVDDVDDGREMSYEDAVRYPVSTEEEGHVLRFTKSGLRAKVKGAVYLQDHRILTNTSVKDVWRTFHDGENEKELDAVRETGSPRAYNALKTAHDHMMRQHREERDKHENSLDAALRSYGVDSVNDVPKEEMKYFTAHLKENTPNFNAAMALAKGHSSKVDKIIWRSIEPRGSTSILSLVSAEKSEVGDADDDMV